MIQPRNDRVLIERLDEQPKGIVLTDADKSQIGVVRAVGPGKWIEGTWWKVRGSWQWFDGYRDDWGVKPGDKVCFNSKWHDLGDNYEHAGRDRMHLVQIADILALINE